MPNPQTILCPACGSTNVEDVEFVGRAPYLHCIGCGYLGPDEDDCDESAHRQDHKARP